MTIDDLNTLLNGSDLGAMLPELDPIVERMAMIMKVGLLIGPAILLILGLVYLFLSPKEANYTLGYRCYFGMGSVRAWRYSQRLAGIVFSGVGLILTLVMVVITGGFNGLDIMDMLWKTIRCGIWEAVIIILSILAINITVAIFFDRKGRLRKSKGTPEESEEIPV